MLPIPNAAEVEKFKKWYLKEFDVELTGAQALEVATCTLQLFYIKNYPRKPDPDRKSPER